jgi:hypothetical protein
MRAYAILLAGLTWALGAGVYGQGAGGGGGGAGAGGGGTGGTGGGSAGSVGRAPGASGATGGTINPGTVTPPGGNSRTVTPPRGVIPPTGTVPRPMNPAITVPPGTAGQGTPGTPGRPVAGPGTGRGADTGSIGGIGPGTGGTGGNIPGTTLNPLDSGVSATTGVQPGASGTTPGLPGTGAVQPGTTPNTPAGLQTGVTTQPGVGIGETAAGTPTDMIFAQRVRGQLLNSLTTGTQASPNTARTGVQGLTPQSLANVQINANNGTVSLLGTVRSEADRRLLENQIRRMGGVQNVVNNLVVAPGVPRTGLGTPGRIGNATGAGAGSSIPAPGTGATQLPGTPPQTTTPIPR